MFNLDEREIHWTKRYLSQDRQGRIVFKNHDITNERILGFVLRQLPQVLLSTLILLVVAVGAVKK